MLSTSRKQNRRKEREAVVSQEGKNPQAAAGRKGRSQTGGEKGAMFSFISHNENPRY